MLQVVLNCLLRQFWLRWVSCCLGIFAFAACQVPSPEAPGAGMEIPAQFGPSNAESRWIARLTHPSMQALIEEVWENNPNLRQMAAQLDAARAEARRAGSTLQPQLNAGIEASRQDTPIAEGFRIRESRYTLSGQASWEIDLWGRNRAGRDAAEARLEASQADYEAARLALAANAVLLWIELAESHAQNQLAEQSLTNLETSEAIVANRFEAGLASALDLRLARTSTAAARNQWTQRQRQQDGLKRALETLLGRYPSARMEASEALPQLPPELEPGIPSELLERRPDIRAAAARYEAAAFAYASAQRARLPSLSLTGRAGTSSSQLNDLLQSDAFIWNLAASLTAPVWDGGRLAAETDIARAQIQQAAEAYAETALQAFREVETALAAEGLLADEESSMQVASEEAQAAEGLALERYERGLIPFTTVLEAQQRSTEYQSQLLSIRSERLKNHIDLLLALGGDFLHTP